MNKRVVWILIAFFILYFTLGNTSTFYTDYEWFNINNGLDIFWVLFFTKFNVSLIFGLILWHYFS